MKNGHGMRGGSVAKGGTAPKRRILVVLYYYLPYISGLSEYARRLAEALVVSGFEVTVLSTQYDETLPREESIAGVRVLRTRVLFRFGKGVVSPSFARTAIRLSRTHDVVHLHLPLPDAGIASPFIDAKKIVVTYHCDINLGQGLLNKLVEKVSYLLMAKALGKASRIVGNSIAYFEQSKFARYKDKFTQIYPPIDTSHFQRTVDRDFIGGHLNVDEAGFKIGFVGRVVFEKGLSFLFEAIPYLKERIPRFTILIAGDDKCVAGGSVRRELEVYTKDHPGIIRFVGKLSHDELVRFYSNIDVLVLPSIDPLESFGMVQVESMCCGTPVVASDLPGVNEVIAKTGFGRLAAARDAKSIAEGILAIHAGAYQGNGFKPAEWDMEQTVNGYVDLFAQMSASEEAVT